MSRIINWNQCKSNNKSLQLKQKAQINPFIPILQNIFYPESLYTFANLYICIKKKKINFLKML